MDASREAGVVHYLAGKEASGEEKRRLVGEELLTVEVVGAASYTIMRTPGNDRELAVGFLRSEGVVDGMADIGAIAECPDDANRIRVHLDAGKRVTATAERNLAVTSSCGLCGRSDIESLLAGLPVAEEGFAVAPDLLYALPDRVRDGQALFRATGASHAAALFTAAGEVTALREDLGRHNALDKVVGHAMIAGLDMAASGVFLSGRVSLEMVIKVARAGVSFVAAVSAASAAAVEAAERLGITVCGFVRGGEITVYTGAGRVKAAAAP